MIKLLRERGKKMIKGDWKKVRKITAKINELKDLNLEKLTKPVSAFVTF
jgi:hypothetical protein